MLLILFLFCSNQIQFYRRIFVCLDQFDGRDSFLRLPIVSLNNSTIRLRYCALQMLFPHRSDACRVSVVILLESLTTFPSLPGRRNRTFCALEIHLRREQEAAALFLRNKFRAEFDGRNTLST